jgi:hypothetical protein
MCEFCGCGNCAVRQTAPMKVRVKAVDTASKPRTTPPDETGRKELVYPALEQRAAEPRAS